MWGRAGNFSGKGPSRVLAGCPVSHGPGPQGGRVIGKVLVPGAVAKSSVMRKKLGSEALGCPLPCPPFRCWGLKEGPLRKAGTRKRCGLDTPPSQTLGGGGGAWYGGPAGAERGRGVGAGALPPREGGPGQVHAGRGQALSPPRSCGDPTPVSGGGWRPADARGVGGGWAGERRGGENPQQNLRRRAHGST